MTALAAERPARPAPDTPMINSTLIHGHDGPVARYADDAWPLGPLSDNPSADRRTIYWNKVVAVLREELRYLSWLLINEPVPDRLLFDQAPSYRSRLGAPRIYATALAWRNFARWLAQRGLTSLADCSERDYRDYIRHLTAKGTSRDQTREALNCLTRLWVFDSISDPPLGLPEPPWQREGADDFLPAATSRGENMTEPISPATMGPLLIWAVRVIDEFSADILTAWQTFQRMTTAAAQNTATKQTLVALNAYLADLAAHDRPLPSMPTRNGRGTANTYISALTGASRTQCHSTTKHPAWRNYLQRNPGPCPLPMKITATVDGRPWTRAIDFTEATTLMKHLVTAAFIVVSYLTGMRPGEVLGLRAGCCPDPESGHHLIHGHVFKTARDDSGNHLSAGQLRDVPWVAIPPVVRAIRILEHIVPDGLLFSSAAHDFSRRRELVGSATKTAMGDRIERFVTWANTLAADLGRPYEIIPADPHGAIGTARFRRTLAWHIARRPGGLVALAIQYGHLRTAVSGHYASRSRDGVHDLLDIETARATADTLAELNDTLATGDGISGPAARRAIQAAAHAPAYAGAVLTARDARNLLANPALAVHNNPHALLLCVYDPRKALCRRQGQQAAPSLDRCVADCANISRTDQQAHQLVLKAEALEKQAAGLVPEPLAERLRARADTLRLYADQHECTRITLQEPSA
ncbi:hypothetical protein [Streptosporangium sp. NPDC049046]|uniref:hypothetical protein n=1 Tax=Streptosporangium sp. NPDC049046 TaxID=3155031 RepID=UPI0034470461